ncbi:MAG TPA: sensor histidine kinase [Gammaproteobacteria bacterium]|nr:sensor histidine kinase [Gammaproteobacteria bacterium]
MHALTRFGRAFVAPLLWLHRRLLPRDESVGWVPYLWLPYLSFFVLNAIYVQDDWSLRFAAGLALMVFLFLFFRFYWAGIRERYRIFTAITVLGLVCLPINGQTLLLYAAAFCGFTESMKRSLLLLASVLAAAVLESFIFGIPYYYWIYLVTFGLLLGLANAHFGEMHRKNAELKRSHEEIQRLAATAERERIARDLHDLLGHTLTLITVKAELASRLAERDLPDAAREIREVECISREALQQVREAVGGYRNGGVAAELVNARIALDSAHIALGECDVGASLPARHDAMLALILREAVTNVVRHSGARHCTIHLETVNDTARLWVEDDGRGGRFIEGNGIRGMRERLGTLDGDIEIRSSLAGTSLCASLPLSPRAEPVQTGLTPVQT